MTATKNKILCRSVSDQKLSIREDDDKNKYIEGYAVVFNQRSKLIREWGEKFHEIIQPTAFDVVLANRQLNTIATVNHDRDKMLARVKSGTLTLEKDERGIKYTILVPDTTLGHDTAVMVARGDYFESSFVFTAKNVTVERGTNGAPDVHIVNEIENLYDVSIVIDGAYANTAIKLRSYEWIEHETDQTAPEISERYKTDILKKKLQILKFQ